MEVGFAVVVLSVVVEFVAIVVFIVLHVVVHGAVVVEAETVEQVDVGGASGIRGRGGTRWK